MSVAQLLAIASTLPAELLPDLREDTGCDLLDPQHTIADWPEDPLADDLAVSYEREGLTTGARRRWVLSVPSRVGRCMEQCDERAIVLGRSDPWIYSSAAQVAGLVLGLSTEELDHPDNHEPDW